MQATVHSSKTIHNVNIFKIITENITLPNGVTTDVHLLRHPGAAAVVALTDHREVVLIRQYRHAVGGFIWEIPAGTRNDRNEPPLACARRELAEESGYDAQNWQALGRITPVPGYSDEEIYLYLATGLTAGQQNLDPDELLEVTTMPFTDALAMIFDGRISDAKTISGLLMANHRLNS